MNKFSTFSCALALASVPLASGMAADQEKRPESFTYATYFYCDFSKQERVDEVAEKLYKPFYDAAVADGSITSWGWLAHNTGGKWRRLIYHTAPSIEALYAAQKRLGDAVEAKDKKSDQEASAICNSHDDYIWHGVAGSAPGTPRGKAGFSTYYVCDMAREDQADELVKRVFGPMYDKLIADGKLLTWGWQEHVVGGEYRRLATFTAADVNALMAVRTSIVAAQENDPLADAFTSICGSHTDYVWDLKNEKP